jgi:hypothetical protein
MLANYSKADLVEVYMMNLSITLQIGTQLFHLIIRGKSKKVASNLYQVPEPSKSGGRLTHK